ncbi:hypothetical protein HDU83_003952 [Entophlyctis luteolus]|nr:hypothetical protein HDU83_003952 [Entophlyctis luteolus]
MNCVLLNHLRKLCTDLQLLTHPHAQPLPTHNPAPQSAALAQTTIPANSRLSHQLNPHPPPQNTHFDATSLQQQQQQQQLVHSAAVSDHIDLATESGEVIDLSSKPKEYAKKFLEPRQSYILVRVIGEETDDGPATYIPLLEQPGVAPATTKKGGGSGAGGAASSSLGQSQSEDKRQKDLKVKTQQQLQQPQSLQTPADRSAVTATNSGSLAVAANLSSHRHSVAPPAATVAATAASPKNSSDDLRNKKGAGAGGNTGRLVAAPVVHASGHSNSPISAVAGTVGGGEKISTTRRK